MFLMISSCLTGYGLETRALFFVPFGNCDPLMVACITAESSETLAEPAEGRFFWFASCCCNAMLAAGSAVTPFFLRLSAVDLRRLMFPVTAAAALAALGNCLAMSRGLM